MRFMVDTHVLIRATTMVTSKTEPQHRAEIEGSKKLLKPLSRIPVSAIVASEYIPYTENPDLWGKFEIIAFETEQALLATSLRRKLRGFPQLCPRCLNPKTQPKSCAKCAHHVERRSKEQDLRIAAAADCTPGFNTLYTYDKWLIDHVGPLMQNCAIKTPENPYGPLWDEREPADVIPIKPVSGS